jgi:hypothetical protein
MKQIEQSTIDRAERKKQRAIAEELKISNN